jgi:hypothetical protein
MSRYTVSSIPLAPVSNLHKGTGPHQDSIWVVVPSSVPDTSQRLRFVGQWVSITALLYELNTPECPNWFAVAVPTGIQDFTRAHIFFHPIPRQAGYDDNDYATKAGKWPELFYYMERLGYQMDGAQRSQIIIMPFLKTSAQDTGIFAANWLDIVTDILTDVRTKMGADDGSNLSLSQVVVSSFSIGIVYSTSFRAGAPGLDAYLGETWDFDARYAQPPGPADSAAIKGPAIKYDQRPDLGLPAFHVPLRRWLDFVDAPATSDDVHSLIRDYMFLHAASISAVGDVIAPGPSTPDGPAPEPSPGPSPSPGPAPTPSPGPAPEPAPSPSPSPQPAQPAPPPSPAPQPAPSPSPEPQPAPATIPTAPVTPTPQTFPVPVAPLPGAQPVPKDPAPSPSGPLPSYPYPVAPGPGPVPNLPRPIGLAVPATPRPQGIPPYPQRQPVAPSTPPATGATPVSPHEDTPPPCCCGAAVACMLANVSAAANTAITAITAIAAAARKNAPSAPSQPCRSLDSEDLTR